MDFVITYDISNDAEEGIKALLKGLDYRDEIGYTSNPVLFKLPPHTLVAYNKKKQDIIADIKDVVETYNENHQNAKLKSDDIIIYLVEKTNNSWISTKDEWFIHL